MGRPLIRRLDLGLSMMSLLRRHRELTTALTVLLTAALVFALLAAAKAQGWLERLELLGHDLMIDAQHRHRTLPDPGVIIVGVTEEDRRFHGDRPSDAVLATTLQKDPGRRSQDGRHRLLPR